MRHLTIFKSYVINDSLNFCCCCLEKRRLAISQQTMQINYQSVLKGMTLESNELTQKTEKGDIQVFLAKLADFGQYSLISDSHINFFKNPRMGSVIIKDQKMETTLW